MALDPYRTLGLPSDASLDEVKRAYRQLAKRYHPDATGDAAPVRFLAVRAAYDAIVGGSAGRPGSRRGSTSPWSADPDRARATREAYRSTGSRRTSTSRDRAAGPRERPAGSPGTSGRPTGARDARPGGASRADPGTGGPSGRTKRPTSRRKATLTSTSYDEAAPGAFEPGWDGSAWYGPSSGTYWTINPREYADPRKHGPEYQERARRATHASGGPSTTVDPSEVAGASTEAEPHGDVRRRADPTSGEHPRRTASTDAASAGAAGARATPAAANPGTAGSPVVGAGRSGGGVVAAGLATGALVAIPSFAVLLSSEMAGDAALAAVALAAPPLAAVAVALALLFGRRLRRL